MNSEKPPFATGDLVVYPSHGVGQIVGIETQEIAGHTLSVFVVLFDRDRMTLRVPLAKAKGLRFAQAREPQGNGCGSRKITRSIPGQAHDVEPPCTRVPSQDCLGRSWFHRGSRPRPLPQCWPA